MTRYKVRPGIVMLTICRQPVLAPSREASAYCHVLQPLPMLWAVTWEAFEKEKPMEKILRLHEILTKKSREEAERSVNEFCEELTKKGFMIRVTDE